MNTHTRSRGYLHEEFRLFHVRDQKDIQFESHFHPFDKIIFFLEGHVSYTIEGKTYILQPQDILLVRHDAVHRPEIDPRVPYERWILFLDRAFLDNCSLPEEPLASCFDLSAASGSHLIHPTPDIGKRLSLLLMQIREAETSPLFGHTLLSRSLIMQLLILLCRCVRDSGDPAHPEHGADARISAVAAYIQTHLEEDLSAETLAGQFDMTPSLLTHRFRRATGYTPHAYVQLKRLLCAAELIANGVSAGDACRHAGYRDYSVFSRAFTKRFGVSPSRYRPELHPFRTANE